MGNRMLTYDVFEELIDSLYDEINIWDDNYTLLYINKACEKHYGMRKEEMIGKNYFEFIKEGIWYPMLLPKVYEEKVPILMEQETLLGESIISIVTPIFDDAGNIKYVVSNIKEKSEKLKPMLAESVERGVSMRSDLSAPIIYKSQEMKRVMELTDMMIEVASPTIILGESGVGKSLLAKYIHEKSGRADKPFVNISCGAIPKDLMESELFGYKGGAFTGANKEGKKGLLQMADGGTVLLDDISELPLMLQSKLLQVVQEGTFTPVGSEKLHKVDIKIIATTNRDLKELIAEGKFREDLFYRLSVFEIEIPPLRVRPDDVEMLAQYFLKEHGKKYNRPHVFGTGVMEALKEYPWRGNVRELAHVLERMAVTVKEYKIEKKDLPDYILRNLGVLPEEAVAIPRPEEQAEESGSFDERVENYKRKLIAEAKTTHKTSRKVAEALQISQSKASRLIRQYLDDEK